MVRLRFNRDEPFGDALEDELPHGDETYAMARALNHMKEFL